VTPFEAVFVISAFSVGCDVKPNHPTKAGTHPMVLPIGSIVEIEGLRGERMSHDVGSGVKGRHLDVFMASCREARAWGKRKRLVRVTHIGGSR
jgi:3D (Asp-Asp-Asp) domain-containing protein